MAAAEPFANVPDVILEEILLRLPSSASLVRAALVSKHWGRVASSAAFLARYRALHPSSPLLGFFFSDRPFGLPAFRLADAVRSDADLRAVERGADLLLAGLGQVPGWRVRDSRNGRLLLCRAIESGCDSFSVYNPVSRRLVTIPADRPHHPAAYFADCLLPSGGDDSFRVVSVQQHDGRIRAVEYDPGARRWCSHHPWQSPWAFDRPKKLRCLEPMHAGAGLIFWRYHDALSLVLDCSTMRFSVCPIPPIPIYAIGEIEDGVGCIVCLDDVLNPTTNGVLKVGLLNTGRGTMAWEFGDKQIPVTDLLGPDARVRRVVQVTNGLALISYDDRYDQFVVDLNKLSRHAEFDFRGRGYAYQMAWPPVGLSSLSNEEAQPVQLVLPVEPAAPLHDVDVAAPIDDAHVDALLDYVRLAAPIDYVRLAAPLDHVCLAAPIDDAGLAALLDDVDIAAPIDDVGVAEPLDDVGIAARIDDVAYTEGPSDVVLRPLNVYGTEHVIAPEADNLVGTVKDGVRLMETETALSSDLVEGMSHSSSTPVVPHANLGALSTQQPTTALNEHASERSDWFCTTCHRPQHGALPTRPRCEEKLQPAGDVPPEHKGQGPTMSQAVSNFDLDADVLELVEHGESHVQLAMTFFSKVKAKLATTGEVRDGMIDRPKSSVPSEASCEDQLQVPVLDVTAPEEFNLAAPAVLDNAVSPTSLELRPPMLHPRHGNAFGSQSQVIDVNEKRRKRDRERYAKMTDEEKQEKLKKRREAYKQKKTTKETMTDEEKREKLKKCREAYKQKKTIKETKKHVLL